MYCEECGREVAAYFGESGRNGYTRGKEHFEKKLAKDEDNSVLWLHSVHHHQGRVDINYTMKVTGSYTEPLDRQTMERVQISNFKGPVLMDMRWVVFVSRGCNIGGGEAARKYLSRMEVPLALFQPHRKESGFPAGGAQGGWRRSGGEAFIFQD